MILVKVIDTPWKHQLVNDKTLECEAWLEENVGNRYRMWDWLWLGGRGYIMLPDIFDTTFFKLKFGL